MKKAIQILTYAYVVIAFIAVISCYASFIFLLRSKNWAQDNGQIFSGMFESWNNDLVFGVRATNNSAYLETPDHYFTKWTGFWPGVVEGCNCPLITDPNLPDRVQGLLKRNCTQFEISSIGCTPVSAVPAVNLTSWITPKYLPIEFFVIRVKNTSFRVSVANMNDDGSCRDGFRNCGDQASISGGYCIKNELECPINDLQNAKGDFKKVSIFEPIDIFYSNDAGKHPISDLYISEDFLCFNRHHNSYTPNTEKFKLLGGDNTNCINDTLAWWITEQPQKAIFDMNKVPYADIPEFAILEDAKYRLFAARAPEWSRKCNSKLSEFEKAVTTLQNIKKDYKKVYEASVVCSTAALVSFVFTALGLYASNIWLYIIPFVPRAFFWVIMVPLYSGTFSKVSEIVTLFMSVESSQCSNSATNKVYTQMGTAISDGAQNNDKYVPLGHFVCFGLEILNLIIAVIIIMLRRKLEREEAAKNAADLQEPEGLSIKQAIQAS